MSATSAPLGLLLPGRPVRTDFIPSSQGKWYLDVSFPRDISEVGAFLLPGAQLPLGGGLAFFYSLPPFDSYTALGVLTATIPSAVWPTGWSATPEIAALPSIRVGVSLETAETCENLATARANRAEARAAGFAQALAADLGTFLSSFAQKLPELGERLVVPPTALNTWLKRVAERFRRDPEFLRNS